MNANLPPHLHFDWKEAPMPETTQVPAAAEELEVAFDAQSSDPFGMQLAPGRVVDAAVDPPKRRTYDAVLIQAGYIMQDDGQPSDWWIPAEVLGKAVMDGLFEGIPHYVDHPEMFGFGWHQRPSVRDLAGIVSEVMDQAVRPLFTSGMCIPRATLINDRRETSYAKSSPKSGIFMGSISSI